MFGPPTKKIGPPPKRTKKLGQKKSPSHTIFLTPLKKIGMPNKIIINKQKNLLPQQKSCYTPSKKIVQKNNNKLDIPTQENVGGRGEPFFLSQQKNLAAA